MKKVFKSALVLLLAGAMIAGCSSKPAATATPTPEGDGGKTATTCPVKIGLVTDTGGVDDKSFNQSAWEGLVAYAEENGFSTEKGVCIDYLQSTSDADYIPNLSTFADEGFDLVIAVGYLFQEAIDTVSANYPDKNFLFIDSVSENANVMSAVYNAEQGSYLVGIAAGLEAKANGSNKVGFVGGMEGDLIGAFQAGYEQGVLAANPDATIYVDYADSFSDDSKGQALAVKQYDAGATVIYQAAGAAGNGVIKEAKERGGVWAIGVDKDQYKDGEVDGKSIILTSMIKRVDISTKTAAQAILEGKFQGGPVVFNLENEGVGAELSTGRNLSDETIKAIEEYATKIKGGEIEVSAVPVIANGASNK
ncbi:BMP family lipoprotein [Anaerorhabdus furcosa]|uniref:Basic membrane protein A n=1 Tax=Anaerorhabdus furcosa TaxID=118967 RepID=A0A1T4NH06_9FIRM|nr:BMP family ABC transporter substrate-binding protein [Anaerorhabdus furcosa]SJZ78403.1 basic membrane protein A [Anaerorhabdus furcosa]